MADLLQQIYDASPYPETKAEVIEGYREQYGRLGKGGWKQAIVNDLAAITGMKTKNLERRFDPSRINNAPRRKEEKAQYRELGKNLPKRIPKRGYRIKGTMYMKFSSGDCEEREVDERIEGDEAKALLKMSEAAATTAVLRHYMEDSLHDEPSARTEGCKEPKLTVTPIE